MQPVEKFFFGVDVVPRGHAKWNAVPVVKWREAFKVLRRPDKDEFRQKAHQRCNADDTGSDAMSAPHPSPQRTEQCRV